MESLVSGLHRPTNGTHVLIPEASTMTAKSERGTKHTTGHVSKVQNAMSIRLVGYQKPVACASNCSQWQGANDFSLSISSMISFNG